MQRTPAELQATCVHAGAACARRAGRVTRRVKVWELSNIHVPLYTLLSIHLQHSVIQGGIKNKLSPVLIKLCLYWFSSRLRRQHIEMRVNFPAQQFSFHTNKERFPHLSDVWSSSAGRMKSNIQHDAGLSLVYAFVGFISTHSKGRQSWVCSHAGRGHSDKHTCAQGCHVIGISQVHPCAGEVITLKGLCCTWANIRDTLCLEFKLI